jgi:hypothetical protein
LKTCNITIDLDEAIPNIINDLSKAYDSLLKAADRENILVSREDFILSMCKVENLEAFNINLLDYVSTETNDILLQAATSFLNNTLNNDK